MIIYISIVFHDIEILKFCVIGMCNLCQMVQWLTWVRSMIYNVMTIDLDVNSVSKEGIMVVIP